jgi:adenosylhomocysteine nucleosidase
MNILYAMAAPAEYGPHLQARITPVMIGVGPVEAAVNLAVHLARLEREGALPDMVVNLGSAGSRTLPQAEIFQVGSIAYRDMDASPLGFEKGTTPLEDHPAEVILPFRIEGLPVARLSTGANVVSGAAYDAIDADMVDMETFAVWRACEKFALPLIGLRGVSDGKHELGHIDDWTRLLPVIDEKLAAAVDLVEAAARSGLSFRAAP